MRTVELLTLLLPLLAGQVDPLAGERALGRARDALAMGRWREARQSLLQALEMGTPEQALGALDQLARLEPERGEWRQRMRDLLQGSSPRFFPDGVREHTQDLWVLTTLAAKGQAPRRLLCNAAFFPAVDPSSGQRASDPRHRWSFDHLRCGYVWEEGSWRLRIRVYYPARLMSRVQRDHEELAGATVRVLLYLYALARDRFGLLPRFSQQEGVVDVWLCEEGEPGGEQWHNNLYLYGITAPRDGLEWLRELAHEYGHHTLPPLQVRSHRYEPWVSGDVGERLYLWHWFSEGVGNQLMDLPWSKEADTQGYWRGYLEYTLRPEWESLCQQGPAGLPLEKEGDQAAEALLSLAFGCDLMWGEPLLRQTFRNLLRRTPADFLRAVERSWQEMLTSGIPLRPARRDTLLQAGGPFLCGPGHPLPYWIFETGRPLRLEVTLTEGPTIPPLVLQGPAGSWELEPEEGGLWVVDLAPRARGWTRVELQSQQGVPVTGAIVRYR